MTMTTNDTLMEQCRKEAPYAVLRLNDRHTPTYVIHGGPVHIAAFWITERDAQSECDLLNDIHAQALYDERSKAKTYSMSKDYDALYDIAKSGEYVLGWMVFPKHKVSALIKWFDPVMHIGNTVMHDDKELFKAECTRLNLEWLAPSAGLTVEEIVRIAGDWFNHVVLDMSAGDDAASDLRSRLTAVIQAKR